MEDFYRIRPKIQIMISNEQLMENCLNQIRDVVAGLGPGQSIAITKNKVSEGIDPLFTIYTKGTVDLGNGIHTPHEDQPPIPDDAQWR